MCFCCSTHSLKLATAPSLFFGSSFNSSLAFLSVSASRLHIYSLSVIFPDHRYACKYSVLQPTNHFSGPRRVRGIKIFKMEACLFSGPSTRFNIGFLTAPDEVNKHFIFIREMQHFIVCLIYVWGREGVAGGGGGYVLYQKLRQFHTAPKPTV